MTFRKNVQRESILFRHWSEGYTVKETAILTSVPEGTVSHYFSRFNRDKKRPARHGVEPPRSSPFDVALTSVVYAKVIENVNQLMSNGEYSKARDYLQTWLLLLDFNKRMIPIMQNVDPEKDSEVIKNIIGIAKLVV